MATPFAKARLSRRRTDLPISLSQCPLAASEPRGERRIAKRESRWAQRDTLVAAAGAGSSALCQMLVIRRQGTRWAEAVIPMVRQDRPTARFARARCCLGTKKTPHCVGGLRDGKFPSRYSIMMVAVATTVHGLLTAAGSHELPTFGYPCLGVWSPMARPEPATQGRLVEVCRSGGQRPACLEDCVEAVFRDKLCGAVLKVLR